MTGLDDQFSGVYLRMNITFEPPYLQDRVPGHIKSFLRNVLNGLKKEIELVGHAFYGKEMKDESFHGVDKVFSNIERTWVGLWTNAMVRNTEVPTFQEYHVYSDTRLVGRCVLLFQIPVDGAPMNFITEVKSQEFVNNWNTKDTLPYYLYVMDQANKYFKEEVGYYPDGRTRMMALFFEWIGNTMLLDKAKDIMKDWKNNPDLEADFLGLYYGTQRGLFVYGKIMTEKAYLVAKIKSNPSEFRIALHDHRDQFFNVKAA